MMEDRDESIQHATAFVKAMFMGGADNMPIHRHISNAGKEPRAVLYAGTHAMYINNWKPSKDNQPALFPTWSKSLVIHATLSLAVVSALMCIGRIKPKKTTGDVEVVCWNVTIPPEDELDDAGPAAKKKARCHPEQDVHEVCIEVLDAQRGFQRGRGDVATKFRSLSELYIEAQGNDLPTVFHELGRMTVGCCQTGRLTDTYCIA